MKVIAKILNIMLAIFVLGTLLAAVGSAITKKPVLLTVIRSNSMYPVWERGDLVIINNLKEKEPIHPGDIVFFKTEEGNLSTKGWIAHRIIEGDPIKGFITKGDANKETDQVSERMGPIERQWIAGRAVVIGETPIVIPKVGYLSLWVEKYHDNPYMLPIFAIVLAIIIAIGELTSEKKHRKKNKGMELQLIYLIGGLMISIIIGGTMLASAQKVNILYDVSQQSRGVLLGSEVGQLMVGDEVSQPLSELSNGGFFKLIGATTTRDPQITLSHQNVILSPGQQLEATYTVTAKKPGQYDSSIHVGLFYPFLPSSAIYFLAQKSYWLALGVVSLIPGLPLIVYPFIDRKMRRKIMKELRRKKRRVQRSFSI